VNAGGIVTETPARTQPVVDDRREFPPQARIHDDRSGSFAPLRSRLLDQDGRAYFEFVQSLTAKYDRVWRDIAGGYLALVVTVLVVVIASRSTHFAAP
jgi:hypothetical protein